MGSVVISFVGLDVVSFVCSGVGLEVGSFVGSFVGSVVGSGVGFGCGFGEVGCWGCLDSGLKVVCPSLFFGESPCPGGR